jgi:hypothetical protein
LAVYSFLEKLETGGEEQGIGNRERGSGIRDRE